ncbi:hypothetical protein [uncultured Bdellovibrio sp.]|uniref:hypothetical protein n=1 Tax=Bdellovibrio sp. HCB-162 TaxID=3394234 RepID=UPI0025D02CC5|nr:hypothetical protein [uncultured Bdellovibrio sp.]
MIKNISLFLLPSLLISCATKPIEQSKLQQLNNVGVVSVLDDQAVVKYTGTTTFSNKEYAANTAAWSLNKIIVDEIRAELKSQNKTSLDVNLDTQKINQGKKEAMSLKNIYLGNRYQGIQQYVLDEAAKQGAKYVFVVHPTLNENFPVHKAGYGFLCQAPVGTKGELEAYFLIGAELWNVQTKKIEAQATVTPQLVTVKTGKTCAEAAKMTPDKLASLYKDQIVSLAKKSADLIMVGTGITKK